MITSKKFTLNLPDWVNGLLAAVAGAVWAIVAPVFVEVLTHPATAKLTFDWPTIWHTAAATAGLYLGYRFIQPAKQVKPVE